MRRSVWSFYRPLFSDPIISEPRTAKCKDICRACLQPWQLFLCSVCYGLFCVLTFLLVKVSENFGLLSSSSVERSGGWRTSEYLEALKQEHWHFSEISKPLQLAFLFMNIHVDFPPFPLRNLPLHCLPTPQGQEWHDKNVKNKPGPHLSKMFSSPENSQKLSQAMD